MNYSQVRFVVKGFDSRQKVSAQKVVELANNLPRNHLIGLKSIVYAPISQFKAMNIPIEHSQRGAFYADYRSVIIHTVNAPEVSFSHLLYHEIGHFVFHVVIGSFLKKEWVTKISNGPPFVTQYAATDKAEDFAECYAFYALNRFDVLSKFPARYHFMKYKVFRT